MQNLDIGVAKTLIPLRKFQLKMQRQFELHQIIEKPTHILENSSCIDVVFTTQSNLIVASGTHHSLHPNYHNQNIYAKFNIKIHYPPPYTRVVWHYKHPNDDLIRRTLLFRKISVGLSHEGVKDGGVGNIHGQNVTEL